MKLTTLRVPDELCRQLDRLAEERHVTRSEVARDALEHYCNASGHGRRTDRVSLLRSLLTYPGSGRGDLARRSEHYLREVFDAKRRRGRR